MATIVAGRTGPTSRSRTRTLALALAPEVTAPAAATVLERSLMADRVFK